MRNVCVIIPDRGDRQEFTRHCLFQLSEQTIQPDKIYLINDSPKDEAPDLVPRIRWAVELARDDGMEYALIIENDDYYPDDYLESMTPGGHAIIGIDRTFYYSLRTPGYRLMYHPGRSALFCTGIRLSLLDDFAWPEDHAINLDKRIWDHASKHSKSFITPRQMPIGIKHGIGLCAGHYHRNGFGRHAHTDDPDMEWLRSRVREESFEFYCNMSKKIQVNNY